MRYILNKCVDAIPVQGIRNRYNLNPSNCNNDSPYTVTDYSNILEQEYDHMGYHILYNDYVKNNNYGGDKHYYVYQVETNDGFFVLKYGEEVVKYIKRTIIKKEQNNLKGGLTHTSKITDKPVEICDAIVFKKCYKYQREDKPGKHFFNVYFSDFYGSGFSTKVMEEVELNSPQCSKIFKPEIVRPFQEKLCSIFFCSEIYRVSKNQIEVMIPSRPGWYYDERYGWVFLEKFIYQGLSEDNLPPLMCKRSIGDKERSVDEVYDDLKAIIETDLHRKVLLAVRLISAILMPLEKLGIHVRTIVAVVVEMVSDMRVAAAILKTGDFEKYDSVSLNSTIVDINKEIGGARDGVAAIIGPLTAKEAKLNAKNVKYIRDAAIGANGADKTVRSVVSLIGRFIPEDLSPDLFFSVKFSNKFDSIDEKMLRSLVIEFEAGYIHYIENNFSEVNGLVRDAVENYKANPKSDIVRDKEGLYIAFIVVQKVLSECFSIKLFNDEEFDFLTNMFKESFTEADVPEYTVRDQFIEAAYKLLRGGRFTIVELRAANKYYPEDKIALILDRKKGFLSFPIIAMEQIAEVIPTVNDGTELAGILKICNSIFCTDNGARQITIPTGRTAFYSVYLSEFGEDILDIIDSHDTAEFFFDPKEVPQNFVPIVWHNGCCAGYVLDGKGLPNPHINNSGLSGMGKNRGAYKTAEGYWRLKSKVIFLDVKGGGTEESLRDMKCDLTRYCFHDLKKEGFPFPIFDLSSFSGNNAKVSYILNVIGAAVDLTNIQSNDLAVYVKEMVSENPDSFSLLELFEKFPPKKEQGLRGKLQPLLHLINVYTPKDNKYKYSSCVEFISINNGQFPKVTLFR